MVIMLVSCPGPSQLAKPSHQLPIPEQERQMGELASLPQALRAGCVEAACQRL